MGATGEGASLAGRLPGRHTQAPCVSDGRMATQGQQRPYSCCFSIFVRQSGLRRGSTGSNHIRGNCDEALCALTGPTASRHVSKPWASETGMDCGSRATAVVGKSWMCRNLILMAGRGRNSNWFVGSTAWPSCARGYWQSQLAWVEANATGRWKIAFAVAFAVEQPPNAAICDTLL